MNNDLKKNNPYNIMETINTTTDDIIHEQNQPIKKTIIKNKQQIYKKERITILHTILQALHINQNNTIFYSHIVDEDEELHNIIDSIELNIDEYFSTGTWAYKKKNACVDRKYLSIIKSVLKDMNVEINITAIRQKINNKNMHTTSYAINMATIPILTN